MIQRVVEKGAVRAFGKRWIVDGLPHGRLDGQRVTVTAGGEAYVGLFDKAGTLLGYADLNEALPR